ncbi:sarcosine dehydrogenase, mitochondrial [Ceratina calcarata]|uniref:Sarcosine dehydrogenase, mitochondrial n=1 Tax=Ceratina calcarata TaxID=156304 RepID=A0AAJ7J9H6_9HYME|nr:sarcosine dehydrogenase, mitochondrial [Ceratina calcarata]
MLSTKQKLYEMRINCTRLITGRRRYSSSAVRLPDHADVVVIGGGNAGCNALYHLAKRGVNAVLLEKSKLTSGTTWHTAGLVWGVRGPYDTEIQLLATTKQVVQSLENETGLNSGWVQNGGLYPARTKERWYSYQRIAAVSKVFGVEAQVVSPKEARELFPLMSEEGIIGALYCADDGVVDPSMLINALIKSAKGNGAQIFEDCPITKILTKETILNKKKVYGVETPYGTIKTDIILNAAGAWSKKIANMINLDIPVMPIQHTYAITETMEGVQNYPHIRDNDMSTYVRIQGNSMYIGGYEKNPFQISTAPENFAFGLYEVDWDMFNTFLGPLMQLVPKLSTTGIKKTICGLESFTPDLKPIMGEDPQCSGFFYSCGYNSAGMMLGGGCGQRIAQWIINGRPNDYMFNFDIRRFSPVQRNNFTWLKERTYEAYGNNYGIKFPYDKPLSGRNLRTDPFHELLVERGAIMEDCQGWERPAWFSNKKVEILPYAYNETNRDDKYREIVEKECTFNLSPYDQIIREEALACRKSVALFNVSSIGKFYLCGPEAQKAADHLFTASTNCNSNETIYTLMLNRSGGIEADCTVTILEPGSSGIVDPIFKDKAFYILTNDSSYYQTWAHMSKVIEEKGFDVTLHDVTEQIGVLSVQGPNSRNLVERLIEHEISDETFKYATTRLAKVKGEIVRLIRYSTVGELGFELHIPKSSCRLVYTNLIECGKPYNMKHAGHRALSSLSCEKGNLIWGLDIRTDDNPVEVGLESICRESGEYLGKAVIDRLRTAGIKKKFVRLHVDSSIPLWGLEVIYRDNHLVGYLRRGEKGYSCEKAIGHGYIKHPDGGDITKEFLENGNYELEVNGKRYAVDLQLLTQV